MTSLRLLMASVAVGICVLAVTGGSSAAPGSWTQAQVNTSIENGVAYIDTQQNADGSFGSDDPAETGIALAAYGVLANGNFSSLPASYQTHVQNAINYLLTSQDTTHTGAPDYFGSWQSFGTYQTYSTGLALLGLSPFTSVNPGVATAIADGRAFLTGPDFQGATNTSCDSSDGSSTAYFCGGWNYEIDYGRSDESNTGYAMTGLEVTGGVPASLHFDDLNWQDHVQELASNPFAARNDGGADYQPGFCGTGGSGGFGGFCSNANDSGTVLFSYGDLGVPMADPRVAAAITFDQDVLNAYELMLTNAGPSGLQMIAHSGTNEDGSCTPNTGGCDWYTSGDGGFHYSLFALTKGLGSYIAPNLSDATNWYAKVVDLLLSQQNADGSWSQDGRDDFSTVFATGLSVASLGLVAVQQATGTITVHKTVDAGGASPTSFCFTLSPDPGNGQVCADSSGNAVFDNVPAGSYDANETTSPAGYHQVSNDCTGLVIAAQGDSPTCDVHDAINAIPHDVDAHLGIGPDIRLGPKGTNTTAVKADCKNETPAENVHCTLQVSGLPTGCTAESSAGPLATSPGGFLVDDLSSYTVNQTKHFDFKLTTTCNPNLAKGVVAKLTFKMCADGGVIDSDPCNDTDNTPDKSPNVVVKSVKLHR